MMFFFFVFGFVSSLGEDCPYNGVNYMESNQCHVVEGCRELLGDNSCEIGKCLYGYYWNNTVGCLKCAEGAYECPDGISTKCVDGYFFDQSSVCQQCHGFIAGCLDCSREGVDVSCLTCYETYSLWEGDCYSCDDTEYSRYDDNAISCVFDGSSLNFTSCIGGYTLVTDYLGYSRCKACTDDEIIGYSYFADECIESSTPGQISVTRCIDSYCLWQDGVLDTDWKCQHTGNMQIKECTYDGVNYNSTVCMGGSVRCKPLSGGGDTGCYYCGETDNGGDLYAETCTYDAECENVLTIESCVYGPSMTVLYEGACYYCGDNCADCVYSVEEGGPVCNECVTVELWERGYFVDPVANFTCSECADGCHDCTSLEVCDQCVSIESLHQECYDGCPDEWTGDDCTVCGVGECMNGGVCMSDGSVCECNGYWEPPTCEECGCENGGTCSVVDGLCECQDDWGGDICEDFDDDSEDSSQESKLGLLFICFVFFLFC